MSVAGGLGVALCYALATGPAHAADNVAGNLINFDNDGYWSWYMDERAIIDPANGKLLIGSVGGSPVRYPVGRPTGSVDVVTFDLATSDRNRSQLSDIDEDDHNAPGMIVLPDGRYLAMYSNHGNTSMGDYLSRYRISSNQGASWSTEQSFNWQTVTGWNTAPNANNRVSYHNVYYLAADNGGAGRVYNFSRATHQSANSLVFNPTTNTWSWGGQLTESATGGYSTGYIKYASNDVDKIYFMSTETHPRNYNNNVYAGYVSNGVSYDMQGNVVDANIFNSDDTAGNGAVPDITAFTKIFHADATGPGKTPLYSNAWTVDLTLGPDGYPVGLFTTRWKEDDPLGNGSPYGDNEKDNNRFYHHTLFYAKYDGASWHVNPIAKMGRMMYLSEEDYTGLGAINPNDPNTIYVSTPLDPRTATEPPLTPGGPSASPSPTDYFWNPTYQVQDVQHEIYKGVTSDNGVTWTWTPVTQNSIVDNFRPIVPKWDGDNTAVIWFRGTYTTAHDTDAAVVGILDRKHEQLGAIHYVDASTSNTTRVSGTGSWASGPSSAEAGATATDNLWHWRTGTGNNGDVLASGATNTTTTENAPTLKTTLGGLADGVYDVFAYFWANPGQDWRLQAGFAANDLSLFRDNGAQQAEGGQFDASDPLVLLTAASGSALYRAYVGRKEVIGGAAIEVFIDDFVTSTTTTGANRTWYDGLGYGLVSDVIAQLAGDFNGDLIVDAADYTVWRDNLGAVDESAILDNGDGLNGIDAADYEVWRSHFGESLIEGGASQAAVPEPAAGVLIAIASAASLLRRCRRSLAAMIGGLVVVWMSTVPAGAVGTLSYITSNPSAGRFHLSTATDAAPLFIDSSDYAGVARVAQHLQADITNVTGHKPALSIGETPVGREVVLIGTLGKSPLIDQLVADKKLDTTEIDGRWEAFLATIVEQPLAGVDRALVIVGSDKRGTIYGMYDLAAQIGVSPWHWWADVPVKQQQTLSVLPGQHVQNSPRVKYRGIFINDEAPALAGWMQEKFGGHNHKFYDHVYQLILRLKGNYLWPAMWGRSLYDDDPESPKLADEYGIVIGTSHHEPMMRAHVEWERYGEGKWNYAENEATLREFWTEGLRRMGTNESVVTIGMRGDGDEPMSETANIALLERIVADQREIIREVTGKHPAEVPQMWALYKEVQEYYDRGMRVPDDVTLLLCDDNWGNLRKLPKLAEKPRAGGYGIYYHFDYVGGPRNYKWLNTNSIPRIWEQMRLAYEYGADRLWIVNVGDIKPMELPTEFFLDYAWNPETWPVERMTEYTRLWAAEQFGEEHAAEIGDILDKYTQYNSRRKPELLGPETYSLANDREAERVVADYNALAAEASRIGDALPAEYQDAYFQLVLHPVESCANLNELYITVAKNRLYAKQGRSATNKLASKARELFEQDAKLSQQYNREIAGGKWNHMMDQTHIGYTNWQEPPQNALPKVEEIELPQPGALGVAVEGSSTIWPENSGELELPPINVVDRGQTYFEVFNRGESPIAYEVSADAPWLKIATEPAATESAGKLAVEQRYWVSVNWDQAPAGRHRVPITVRGPAGTTATVVAVVDNRAPAFAADFRGHVGTNGCVAIEAEDFDAAVGAGRIKWQVVPGLGRTLSGVTPTPVTAASPTPGGDSPHLEYRFWLSEAGPAKVQAYVSPTLNFHSDVGRRYAVSIDDESPQIVNIHAGENLQLWEKWVADNINITTSKHEPLAAGEHTLKFWMVDPGIVLQRIVVDQGEVQTNYLGPPKSTRWPKNASVKKVTAISP